MAWNLRKDVQRRILILGMLVLPSILLLGRINLKLRDYQPEPCTTLYCSAVNLFHGLFESYSSSLRFAALTLTARGPVSDLVQDIGGFRGLVRREDAYPIIQLAAQELGLDWRVDHRSTHPPTAFLFVSSIAFLPWNVATTIWAWFMLALCAATFRCYGAPWKVAIGLTPVALLWQPVALSLGQFTIVWLFALAMAHRLAERREFYSGVCIALAALPKFFASFLLLYFLINRKWRAPLGFALVWLISLLIIFLLNPNAISQYLSVNTINSEQMIRRADNASLIINSYRSGGLFFLFLVGLLFMQIIRAHIYSDLRPPAERSIGLWFILTYFSVVLLPVFWIYSVTPLLPVILYLILSKRSLAAAATGWCCLALPNLSPGFGVASIVPLVSVSVLVGVGLLLHEMGCGSPTVEEVGATPRTENY